MSWKYEDRLLSTLAKYEILKLPGMSQYKDLPVKELKVKLNEICKTRGLKRGSKIKDFINIKNSKENAPKAVDRTDYSKNKDKEDAWFNKYKDLVEDGIGVEISITNYEEQVTAFDRFITYLLNRNYDGKILILVGKNAEGQEHTIPITAKNRKDLEKVTIDMVTHKIRMPLKVSDGDVVIDDSSVFLADTLRVDVYNFIKKGRKENIKKSTAIIPTNDTDEIETVIDLDQEFNTRGIRDGAFWGYLNKTKIDW